MKQDVIVTRELREIFAIFAAFAVFFMECVNGYANEDLVRVLAS